MKHPYIFRLNLVERVNCFSIQNECPFKIQSFFLQFDGLSRERQMEMIAMYSFSFYNPKNMRFFCKEPLWKVYQHYIDISRLNLEQKNFHIEVNRKSELYFTQKLLFILQIEVQTPQHAMFLQRKNFSIQRKN